jgi:hypothetical protein
LRSKLSGVAAGLIASAAKRMEPRAVTNARLSFATYDAAVSMAGVISGDGWEFDPYALAGNKKTQTIRWEKGAWPMMPRLEEVT